jgi:hypothetical protein
MARTTNTVANSDGQLPYSTVLAQTVLAAIEDRLSLRNSPALLNVRSLTDWEIPRGMQMSGTVRLPVRQPRPLMGATDEATAIASETTIDMDYVALGFADKDLTYGVTDTLRRADATGEYQIEAIAAGCVESMEYTLTDMVCVLADSWSIEVGSSGSPATWDLVREGAQQNVMRGKAEAGDTQVAILHPAQWAQIQDDFGSSDGARANRRELDISQAMRQSGYQGTYDNIDVWTCDRVPLDGSDYSGQAFAPGAVGYLEVEQAPLHQSDADRVLIDIGVFRVELVRDASGKGYKITAIYTVGVGIIRPTLGCRILSTGKAILS